MSIKRLHPEAVETFSIVLHPKRTYSARKAHDAPAVEAGNFLLTEGGDTLTTEDGVSLELEL